MNRLVAALVFLLSGSSLLVAQERLSLSEITQNFPEAKYHQITYLNLEEAKKSGLWDDFILYNWKSETALLDDLNLPPQLLKNIVSVTSLRLDDSGLVEFDKQRLSAREEITLKIKANGIWYCDNTSQTLLRSINYSPDTNLEKIFNLLSYQRINGGRLGDKKLVFYKIPELHALASSSFAYINSNNQFFLSNDKKQLKLMVAASLGLEVSADLNESFSGINDIASDLGYYWQITNDTALAKAIRELREKREDLFQSFEEIENQEAKIIIRGFNYPVTNTLQKVEYIVYAADKLAEDYLKRIGRTQQDNRHNPSLLRLQPKTQYQQKDNWIIKNITPTKALLAHMRLLQHEEEEKILLKTKGPKSNQNNEE